MMPPIPPAAFGSQRERAIEALYKDGSGSLGELREAVTTLEEIERVEQRVLGGAHPTTLGVEDELRDARAALRARETSP